MIIGDEEMIVRRVVVITFPPAAVSFSTCEMDIKFEKNVLPFT